jgi:WD40 repeat protein
MRQLLKIIICLGLFWVISNSHVVQADVSAEENYKTYCAECHQAERLGSIGPALLPENLKRLRKKKAVGVIANGREATQMPAHGDKLSEAEINALVELIYTPLPSIPKWGMDEIIPSQTIHNAVSTLPDKPVHQSDLLNLFTVVETGDHHVTILDGDTFDPIWRFKSHFALHGGAKYSPDGRYVYFGSRDGWVSKYDLWSLKQVAEIRAGINTRNIAVSSDGKWVMVGNYLPHSIVVLNAEDLTPFRYIPVADGEGVTSRVSAVYDARPRISFIAALKDIKEIWELSYDPEAEPIREGFQHNFRKGEEEGFIVSEQPFGIRRIAVDDYMDDFFFDPYYAEVIGASRTDKKGVVYNLDVRKKVSDLDLSGMPHLGSGIVFDYQDRMVMATPHIKDATISVIDMETWETIKRIETLGPGFFARSHENTPYFWVDVFFGEHKDAIHIIDKRTLEIVKTLRHEPNQTVAHVEFTRDGRYALVSIWEEDGAIIVYDAETFAEIKRIPMSRPSGKYNVFNKINLSSGTSH